MWIKKKGNSIRLVSKEQKLSHQKRVASLTLHHFHYFSFSPSKMNGIKKTMMTSNFFTISSLLFFIIFVVIGKSFLAYYYFYHVQIIFLWYACFVFLEVFFCKNFYLYWNFLMCGRPSFKLNVSSVPIVKRCNWSWLLNLQSKCFETMSRKRRVLCYNRRIY